MLTLTLTVAITLTFILYLRCNKAVVILLSILSYSNANTYANRSYNPYLYPLPKVQQSSGHRAAADEDNNDNNNVSAKGAALPPGWDRYSMVGHDTTDHHVILTYVELHPTSAVRNKP